jgi:hypothetical protein
MSNEYKDWERDRIEEEKQVVTKYPFLRLRNIDGTVDTDSEFPMMGLEIPNGWYPLFYQMCDDIKPLLEEEGILNDFYFLQVKEKYNKLICYSNGIASSEVEVILQKYEYISEFICTKCGKPAAFETRGYIASFCNDCWKDFVRHEKGDWLKFLPAYEVVSFQNGNKVKHTISVEDEWDRYLQKINFKATNYSSAELCPSCGTYTADGSVCITCQKKYGIYKPKNNYTEI